MRDVRDVSPRWTSDFTSRSGLVRVIPARPAKSWLLPDTSASVTVTCQILSQGKQLFAMLCLCWQWHPHVESTSDLRPSMPSYFTLLPSTSQIPALALTWARCQVWILWLSNCSRSLHSQHRLFLLGVRCVSMLVFEERRPIAWLLHFSDGIAFPCLECFSLLFMKYYSGTILISCLMALCLSWATNWVDVQFLNLCRIEQSSFCTSWIPPSSLRHSEWSQHTISSCFWLSILRLKRRLIWIEGNWRNMPFYLWVLPVPCKGIRSLCQHTLCCPFERTQNYNISLGSCVPPR